MLNVVWYYYVVSMVADFGHCDNVTFLPYQRENATMRQWLKSATMT